MMLRTVVLTGLVLVQTVASGFKPERAVVLRPDAMPAGQRWCSRPGPALSDDWRPDADVIRDLEAAMAPVLRLALEKETADSSRPALDIADYYGQYFGIRAGGRRIVYVNGFHRTHVESTARVRPELAASWKTRAVNVCDGGRLFFGVEYDPETRKVGVVHFNGAG